jgi:hypothetical protein
MMEIYHQSLKKSTLKEKIVHEIVSFMMIVIEPWYRPVPLGLIFFITVD